MKAAMLSGRIWVVLCDDHALFRRGVAEMLATSEDIEVVGEADTHERAVATVSKQRPDVVLFDLEMPGMGAEEAMRRMFQVSDPPRVIILTMHDEPRLIRYFLGRGATAYLSKSASIEEVLDAVRNAAARPRATAGDEVRGMPDEMLEDTYRKTDGLSKREIEILLQVARGLSNQQAAQALHLSEATIKRHLANIYNKMGVGSRAEATQKALARGWISSYEISDGGDH